MELRDEVEPSKDDALNVVSTCSQDGSSAKNLESPSEDEVAKAWERVSGTAWMMAGHEGEHLPVDDDIELIGKALARLRESGKPVAWGVMDEGGVVALAEVNKLVAEERHADFVRWYRPAKLVGLAVAAQPDSEGEDWQGYMDDWFDGEDVLTFVRDVPESDHAHVRTGEDDQGAFVTVGVDETLTDAMKAVASDPDGQVPHPESEGD